MTIGRNSVSKNKDWQTPVEYIDAVREFFDGIICLDPCSNEHSIIGAENEFKLPEKDGLVEIWNHETVYVNPPYGRNSENKTSIKNWIQKCTEAFKKYGSEIIALIPVATNTKHWQGDIFLYAASICFLKEPRLKFLLHGKTIDKGAPMACALVYWGNRQARFHNIFSKFGKVVDI